MSGGAFCGRIEQLLSTANIRVNGDRPWDPQIHNPALWRRVLAEGSLGLGEAYLDGWWDCAQLDEFFHRAIRAQLERAIRPWRALLDALWVRLVNLQRPARAFHIGRHHYDLGNDLYRRMLDRRMIYSCAYWKDVSTLDEAQEAKLDLICRKLALRPGMRVLDIGCGWGGTLQFAAERYGVEGLGITVSREQAEHARQLCAGLPIEIRLQDYRELEGVFDRMLSVGMFEHVGCKNYRAFMRVARRCLKDDGLFLLHTIGSNVSARRSDPWLERYIFPGSMIPSAHQLGAAIDRLFVLEDLHNFGPDYDRTLMCWWSNFDANWPELKARYDERFRRMWQYYLLSCAGCFRARQNQVWQIVLSPMGIPGGYVAPR